ncbi:MAG: sensor histidine kinase [Hyphomicrobium sp.]
MRSQLLGPEVASRVEAMVGWIVRPWSEGALGRGVKPVLRTFSQLSLATRFALASAAILFGGMELLGGWVASRIEVGVLQNAAGASALYFESFVEPLIQQLASKPTLPDEKIASIDSLISEPDVSHRMAGITIWRPDGMIVYDKDKTLIGKKFGITTELAGALNGDVQAKYDHRPQIQGAVLDLDAAARFEIYSPMHVLGTNRVIAVAQISANSGALNKELQASRRDTWLIVGGSTLAMFGILYAIVRSGSRLINQQREALEHRVTEQEALNQETIVLREQLERANRRGTEINERFLRRVSSDLHDGPAQHLALALLRLDELAPLVNAAAKNGDPKHKDVLATVRAATADAMKEIRNISSGLALPELQKISPASALSIAARAHERATGTTVEMTINGLPARLPLPLTICLFRFAQEGLNNAFRHASGRGQRLNAQCDGMAIEAEVSDTGPGFAVEQKLGQNGRLGLEGLRHRVEALGGALQVHSTPGAGTRLVVRFPNLIETQPHG